MTTTAARIQLRRDTASHWTSANPTLLVGEAALETDTGKWKFGDGTTPWSSLPYQAPNATALSGLYGAVSRTGARSVGQGEIHFNVKDYGAAGDGTTDDTTAVNAAVAAATAAGGGTLFFPAGSFSLNTIYVNTSNIRITGAGIGTTFLKRRPVNSGDTRVLAFNSTGPTVTPAAGSYLFNVAVDSLTVDGNNTNATPGTNSTSVAGTVCFATCQNVTVRNVRVVNAREFGVNLWGCLTGDIDGVHVDGMLGSWSVNSINVTGDAYSGSPAFTVNVRPSKNIRVRGCLVTGNWAAQGDSPALGGIGICVQGSTEVIVSNNIVDFTGEPAARGRNGTGIMFEGGGGAGTLLLGKRYVATGNTVTYALIGIGAVDTNGGGASANPTTGILDGYTISNNQVDQSATGIIAHGRNGTIAGNRVGADTCITLGADKVSAEGNFSVTGNTLSPVAGAGISINKQTDPGTIAGVTIVGNLIDGTAQTTVGSGYGIIARGDFTDFTISGNTIVNTLGPAVMLSALSTSLRADRGRIVGNQMTNINTSSTLWSYPAQGAICSSGCSDVLVALNYITGGAGMQQHTISANTPVMTLFGNSTTNGANIIDNGNTSSRIAGTVTGAKSSNTALASLITQLKSVQMIVDSTT